MTIKNAAEANLLFILMFIVALPFLVCQNPVPDPPPKQAKRADRPHL
jgi:hypothetical protein